MKKLIVSLMLFTLALGAFAQEKHQVILQLAQDGTNNTHNVIVSDGEKLYKVKIGKINDKIDGLNPCAVMNFLTKYGWKLQATNVRGSMTHIFMVKDVENDEEIFKGIEAIKQFENK